VFLTLHTPAVILCVRICITNYSFLNSMIVQFLIHNFYIYISLIYCTSVQKSKMSNHEHNVSFKGAICNSDTECLKWVLQPKYSILETVVLPASSSPDSKHRRVARLGTLKERTRQDEYAVRLSADCNIDLQFTYCLHIIR